MKIKIVCVGKIKEKYFTSAIEEYTKRISRFAKIEVKEVDECLFKGVPSASEIEKIIDAEGKAILQETEGFVFVLDIGGKELSSVELSACMSQAKQSSSCFTFVIGGSYGLSSAVKQKANVRLSFGKITLPHQLCRVVLCEQIYRAFTIEGNIPYHK